MLEQRSLLDEPSPASEWDQDATRRALDELFTAAQRYSSSKDYYALMRFVGRFRFYSPFNAMLVHIQMPGATFVALAHRWRQQYGRRIKVEARPLVILRPMGPVMFVFDVSDTEPLEGAPPLPAEVEHPFEVGAGKIGSQLGCTIENAKRDGVRVAERPAGSQAAGLICAAPGSGQKLQVLVKHKPRPEYVPVRLRYEVLLNSGLSPEARYAAVAHELGHLYCGHLGTPDDRWWPDRRGLADDVREFEAESVCYLLCQRLGIDNPSERYLAQYVAEHQETPAISLSCVLKSAGLIEQMGRQHLSPRKERQQQ